MSLRELMNAQPERKPFPKLVPGIYDALVTEATYGPNQAGTSYRTMVKVQITEDGDYRGKLANTYISAGSDEQAVRQAKPWLGVLGAVGVSEDVVMPADLTDRQDLLQNIALHLSRALRQGKVVKVKLDVRASNDPEKPYINVLPPAASPVASEPANAAQLAAFAAASAPTAQAV